MKLTGQVTKICLQMTIFYQEDLTIPFPLRETGIVFTALVVVG